MASVEVDSNLKILDSSIADKVVSVDDVLEVGATSLNIVVMLVEEYSVVSKVVLDIMVEDSSTKLLVDAEVVNVTDELEVDATSLTIVAMLEKYSVVLLEMVEVSSTVLLVEVEIVVKLISFTVVSIVEDFTWATGKVLLASVEAAVDSLTPVVDKAACVVADDSIVKELG